MLRIRLSRHGAKKDPHYRVVVIDKRSPRDGKFIEILGYYNPAMKPARLNLDLERVRHWLANGAQPTETVRTLIRRVQSGEGSAPAAVSEPASAENAETA